MDSETKILKDDFQKKDYQRYVLVGDVGGTNTYIAVMGVKTHKSYDLIFRDQYKTKDIKAFHDILNLALKRAFEEYGISAGIACIGAAGPISRRRESVKLTNVDLALDVSDLLSKTLLNKIILVNDFEAKGYGIDLLDLGKDVIELPHAGEDLTGGKSEKNTFALIGAGSGLGMCIAPYNKSLHLHTPLPSEGGHMDMVAYDDFEHGLVRFLKEKALAKKDVNPEIERVLSGEGLLQIYEYVKQQCGSTQATGEIDSVKGTARLEKIGENYERCSICKKTIDAFLGFYARTARNLALVSECYSGLFITGKIALNNISRMKDKRFMEEFEKHDKRSDVLRKVPVYLVTNQEIGLYGCCNIAVNFFNID